MKDLSQKEKDLEEIFEHIQKIRQEPQSTNSELEPVDIIKNSTGKVAGALTGEDISPEDIFEVVGPIDETQKDLEEPISKMTLGLGSAGVCDICGEKIVFEKNLAGLVVSDKFFACEKCCQDASKKNLDTWTESKNAKPEDVRPIAFWLMQLKNKNRLM